MFLRTTGSALAVLVLTAPAFAAVTPAEVWQNWIEYYKANGYTVTEGARDEAGETLTLRDVVIAYKAPQDEATVQFTLPEVVLTGTGDGNVRTTLAETSPATISFRNEDDEMVTLTGSLTMKDAEIVTSGEAADMTHDARAAEVVASLDSVRTAEQEKPFPLSLKMLNMTSRQHVVDGPLTRIDATMAADRIEWTGAFDDTDGESPARISFDGGIDRIQGSGSVATPKGIDTAKDINAALKAGMSVNGTMTAGAGRFAFDFAGKDDDGNDQAAKGSAGFEGAELTGGMSADGLKYQGSADATSAEMTGSDLPMPVSYAMQSTTFDLQVPVMKSESPVPFKFAYSIGGLTIADGVWDLFDSARVLPRDPASLDIDITGMAALKADLLDPANLEDDADAATDAGPDGESAIDPDAQQDAQPFEPTEITVNKLALDAAGARIDASGALKVPDGGSMDAPVGKLTARVEGANGLIDKLTQMGLIAEDQVAGFRMMLAMFAKPAPEGGDALVSELEFKEGGQIFANGQQVK